jgi:hypothetical protein
MIWDGNFRGVTPASECYIATSCGINSPPKTPHYGSLTEQKKSRKFKMTNTHMQSMAFTLTHNRPHLIFFPSQSESLSIINDCTTGETTIKVVCGFLTIIKTGGP